MSHLQAQWTARRWAGTTLRTLAHLWFLSIGLESIGLIIGGLRNAEERAQLTLTGFA
jgi:hypothetical protein